MPAPKLAILVVNGITPPDGWPQELSNYEILTAHGVRDGLEILRQRIEKTIMAVVCPKTDKNDKLKVFFRKSRVFGFQGAMLIPESAEAVPRVILEHLKMAALFEEFEHMPVPGTQWESFQQRRNRSPRFPLRA